MLIQKQTKHIRDVIVDANMNSMSSVIKVKGSLVTQSSWDSISNVKPQSFWILTTTGKFLTRKKLSTTSPHAANTYYKYAHVQTVIAVCWGGWALTESMTLFNQPLHLASHLKFVFWWLILFITDANKWALWLWLWQFISDFTQIIDRFSTVQ